MHYFADKIIKPYIAESRYRRICEIGAARGDNTDKLLEIADVSVSIIDPGLDLDLYEKYRNNHRVQLHKGLSLDVLKTLSEPFDSILIDGDHNWFTVYNELKTIHERDLLKPGGTIFLHDVGFPYGRRDMYYQPELIPQEFTQPFAKKGIVYGQSELSETEGANAHLCNADHEGGARNGVLTAVEDFLRENERKYQFYYLNEEHGLGVVLKNGDAKQERVFKKYKPAVVSASLPQKLKQAVKEYAPGVHAALRKIKNNQN